MIDVWLQLAGVVVSFVGSMFLAVSQKGISQEAALVEELPGRPPRISAFVFLRHPRLWRAGFVLLAIGFAFQFLGYVVALMASGR